MAETPEIAPDVTLVDADGTERSLAAFRGRTVVLPVPSSSVWSATLARISGWSSRRSCAVGRMSISVVRSGLVRPVASARIPPPDRVDMTVPLSRGADGACTVRFEVARTAVPGSGDRRRLGAHFVSFAYRP